MWGVGWMTLTILIGITVWVVYSVRRKKEAE